MKFNGVFNDVFDPCRDLSVFDFTVGFMGTDEVNARRIEAVAI